MMYDVAMYVYHMGEYVGADASTGYDYTDVTFDITEGDEYTIILVATDTYREDLSYSFEVSLQ